MTLHADPIFAPLDPDGAMERIAGGNESEVYRSDDQRFVVKVKSDMGGTVAEALDQANGLRAAAERFSAYLGPQYSLTTHYLIVSDTGGRAQVLAIQPFVEGACALFNLDYDSLSLQQRSSIAYQLREIVRRSLEQYRASGEMPDLYGRSSTSHDERARMRSIWMLPIRMWSFLVQRNLLRSHNLMLIQGDEMRIILVDYDPVRRGRFYRTIYYLVRWALFFRDHTLILLMRRGGPVPRAE
jgi:hypothetical protein